MTQRAWGRYEIGNRHCGHKLLAGSVGGRRYELDGEQNCIMLRLVGHSMVGRIAEQKKPLVA